MSTLETIASDEADRRAQERRANSRAANTPVARHILIVDDDLRQFGSISLSFQAYDTSYNKRRSIEHSIVSAATEEQAIRALKKTHYDIILIDINLGPNGDGISLLERVVSEFPQVCPIMLSGRDDSETIDDCHEKGAREFITKTSLNRKGGFEGAYKRIVRAVDWFEKAKKSLMDPLTKIYHRGFFDETLAIRFSEASRTLQPLSLMIFDADHFKNVNDTYGHPMGDEVLVEIAYCCQSKIRDYNTVCRYGGEEFAIIMPGAPFEIACETASRLWKSIGALEFKGEVKGDERFFNVTISGGVATYHPTENYLDIVIAAERAGFKEPDDKVLLKCADTALYKVKHGDPDGHYKEIRNGIYPLNLFSKVMDDFVVAVQPQLSLTSAIKTQTS